MQLKKLTEVAVNNYFNDNQDSDLEKIISELAREYELNNNEIARVVQGANTKVYLKLYDITDDKTVEFDVAIPENIIADLDGVEIVEREFGDEYFSISTEEDEEVREETPTITEDVIKQLVERGQNLIDERDSIKIKLFEKKPKINKLIKVKAQRHGEEQVKQAVKEACIKPEGEILVDMDTNFLNKVASYAKLENRLEEVQDELIKISSIFGAAKGASKGLLGAAKGIQQVTKAGKNAKKHKNKLDKNNFNQSRRTRVKNYKGGY